MMFPGRGTPTMRCRNSPARQMAKMMASCNGILISGANLEIIFFFLPLTGNVNFSKFGAVLQERSAHA